MPQTAPLPSVTKLLRRASSAYNAANFAQAIEHSRAALLILISLNEENTNALQDEAYERLVLSYQRTGEYAEAAQVITEWRANTERPEGKVRSLIQHSRVTSFQGDFDTAHKLVKEASEQATEIGYEAGMGLAKRVEADLYWKRGHTDQALVLGQQALTLLESAHDLEQQAATLVSLAAAYHHSGQFYKALQHEQRAVHIIEQLGRQFELAIVHSNLGESYAEIYAMDRALEAHQKALELVGMERAHPDLLRNLGVDLIAVGREEEGREYLNTALERARTSSDPDMIAQTLHSLARIELRAGNLDTAETHAGELLEIANRISALRHRMRAWLLLGDIARQRGDQERARQLFNDCSMEAQQASDRYTIWRTHAALADLMQETLPQMAEIHHRMAAEMMNDILAGITDEDLARTFRSAEEVQAILGPV